MGLNDRSVNANEDERGGCYAAAVFVRTYVATTRDVVAGFKPATTLPGAPSMGADLEVKVLCRGGNPYCEPKARALS